MTYTRTAGLLAGLVLGGLMIGTFYLGFAGLSLVQIYLAKFLIIGAYLATILILFRMGDGNRLYYKKGRGISFLIAGIAALVIGLYNYIFHQWIDPGFWDENVAMNVERMREDGMNALEIEERVAAMKFWLSPFWIGLSRFFVHLIMGMLLGFMAAWITGDKTQYARNPK